MRVLAVLTLCSLLAGCQWMGRQADAIGEYMPVIGERCHHWQCMTSEGQRRSEAIAAMEEQEEMQKAQQQGTQLPTAEPETQPVNSARPPNSAGRKSFPASPQ